MSKQDIQDAALLNRGEAVSTAAHDAQQQARDRISPARPTVCGLWIVARDQANLYESLQYAYRDGHALRRLGEPAERREYPPALFDLALRSRVTSLWSSRGHPPTAPATPPPFSHPH